MAISKSNLTHLLNTELQAAAIRPSFNATAFHSAIHSEGNEARLDALTAVFGRVSTDSEGVLIEQLLNEIVSMEIELSLSREKLSKGRTGRKASDGLTALINNGVKAQMEINDTAVLAVQGKNTPYEIRVINNGWIQNVLGATYQRAANFLNENGDMVAKHNEQVILNLANKGLLGTASTKTFELCTAGLVTQDDFLQKVLRGFNSQADKMSKEAHEQGLAVRMVRRDSESDSFALDAVALKGGV